MTPFEIAEHYLQLRKKFKSESWVDFMTHMNDLVLTPFIFIFMLLTGRATPFFILTTLLELFKLFREYYSYSTLRYKLQHMFILTMLTGGPHISTNNPDYMPYVFADAVVRLCGRHPDPEPDHHSWTHRECNRLIHENHSQ